MRKDYRFKNLSYTFISLFKIYVKIIDRYPEKESKKLKYIAIMWTRPTAMKIVGFGRLFAPFFKTLIIIN